MARYAPKGPKQRVDRRAVGELTRAASSGDLMVSGDETVPAAGERDANGPAETAVPQQRPDDTVQGVTEAAPSAPSPEAQVVAAVTALVSEDSAKGVETAGEGSGEPARPEQPEQLPKQKVTFMIDRADAQQARSTYLHLPYSVRPGSWSDFIAEAIMERVRVLESEHNEGKPFEPIDAGQLPRGRPVGS